MCDSILFCQIYYYRWKRRQLEAHSGFDSRMREEQDPLLMSENQRVDDVVPAWLLVIRYFGALAFVVVVGVAAWWVTDNEEKSDFIKPDQENNWWIIQLLGWSSALLFVCGFFAVPELSISFHFGFSSVHASRKYVSILFIFYFIFLSSCAFNSGF